MATNKPRVIHIDQYDSPEAVLGNMKKENLAETETAFVFPGDLHAHKDSLYGRYSGKNDKPKKGGLYDVAKMLNKVGVPTVSLPVTNMVEVKGGEEEAKELVAARRESKRASEEAVIDLWKAYGFGINMVIANANSNKNPWEPKGKESEPLAKKYWDALNALVKFSEDDKADIDTFKYKVKISEQVEEVDPNDNKKKITKTVDKDEERTLNKECIKAYKDGVAAQEKLKKKEAVGDWFQKQPSKASNDKAKDYAALYAAQEKARAWKTALFWVVSILSGGLAAYPMYLWWKSEKDNEPVQKVEMPPIQLEQMIQFRNELSKKSAEQKPAIVSALTQDQVRTVPPIARPTAITSAIEPAAYYADKAHKQRWDFWQNAMSASPKRTTPLTADEQKKLDDLSNESIKLTPQLVMKVGP